MVVVFLSGDFIIIVFKFTTDEATFQIVYIGRSHNFFKFKCLFTMRAIFRKAGDQ